MPYYGIQYKHKLHDTTFGLLGLMLETNDVVEFAISAQITNRHHVFLFPFVSIFNLIMNNDIHGFKHNFIHHEAMCVCDCFSLADIAN